jgi:hypothetical protein
MSTATSELPRTHGAILKDLHEVEPINEGDNALLDEIREALERHGKVGRFGISLLHKHFDVAPGEVLLEENDPHARVLTIKPVKAEEAGDTSATTWTFVEGKLVPTLYCPRRGHLR